MIIHPLEKNFKPQYRKPMLVLHQNYKNIAKIPESVIEFRFPCQPSSRFRIPRRGFERELELS